MRKQHFLKFIGAVLATSMLAACGGGGTSFGVSGTTGSTTGGTTGGATPTGIPAALTLAPAGGSSTAATVTVGKTIALTATLDDTAGVPIANAKLIFTTTAGTLSTAPPVYTATASGTTDATGQITVFLLSTSQAGTATVTVTEPVTNISNSTSVTFAAAGAVNVALTAAPAVVAPGGTASVIAQVTDANNNPVASQLVNFGFPSKGNVSGGLFTPNQVATDSNGRASASYQAGPTPGTDTLQASLASGQNSTTSLTVATGTIPVGSITLTLGASSAVADGSTKTAAIATVIDQNNNPIANAKVNFSTSVGQLTATGATPGSAVQATTNASGVAQAFQISPTLAGLATITASTGGFSADQQITFVAGNVAHVIVSASPTTVAPNGTSSITAQLTDANGNVVGNHTVQFSAPSGQFAGGATILTATTSAQGVATVSYVAPASGTVTITATAEPEGGTINNTAQVSVSTVAVPVTGVAVTAGPTSIPANGSSTSTIRATVTGASGPLANVQVNFTSTAGTLSSSTATSDVNGNATVTLTSASSTVPVTATVTAATGGVSGTSQVMFTVSVPTTLTVALTPPTVAINGTTAVNATVLDANGNPVSGATVNFSVTPNNSGGKLTSTSAVTNTSGVATTSYTAGGNAAGGTVTDTIQASIAGLSSGAALTVTNTVQVKSVTLISSSLQLLSSANTPAQGVTLTAVVKDTNNNVVPNVAVQFSSSLGAGSCATATGGALQVINSTTNSSGQAQATLFTGGDTTNQNIVVSATVSGVPSQSITVVETGTKLIISGPASVGNGGTASYTITLTDAGNNPIPSRLLAVTSSLHNPISGTLTTGSNGQITIGYTGTTSGTDTLTAQPSGCATSATAATQSIQVAAQNLVILAPTPGLQIPFGAGPNIFVNSATVAGGGTGYVVGDVLTVVGGTFTSAAQLKVITVSAGVVTGVTLTSSGVYSVAPTNPASVIGGTGSGATFTLTSGGVTAQLTGGTISNVPVSFTTSRGTMASASVNTSATGLAVDNVTQAAAAGNAGGAVITATCTGCTPNISANVPVEFISTTPATLSLQANPSTVGINGLSTITATVLDAYNNLVANQTVNFTLIDNSGGTLLQSSAVTNASGQATVTYQGGSVASSLNGVQITGTVASISPNPTYSIASAAVASGVGGSGYAIGDLETVNNGSFTTPAQLQVTTLGVSTVNVASGGQYTAVPNSPAGVTGGSGTGATFNFSEANTITAVGVASGGTGYNVGDTLTVNGGTLAAGQPAAFFTVTGVTSANGPLTSVSVSNGGGYSSLTGISISDITSAGTGASFTFSHALEIINPTVASGGGGYKPNDTLTLVGGNAGSTAAQLTVATASQVGTVSVSTTGTYSTAPGNPASVTAATGTGSGAMFNLVPVKNGTVLLTVGGQSLRIVLGTGNTVIPLSNTQYQIPYSVLVTDSAGNPPPAGSVVNLVTNADSYQKGSEHWNGTIWVPTYNVNCASDADCLTTTSFGCENEDAPLYNGIYTIAKDYNGNGKLDPGNVATIPASVALDASGTGSFLITYSKDRANWVKIFINATIQVSGNSGAATASFVLPGLSSDFTTQTVSPPGVVSPYGTASNCANPN